MISVAYHDLNSQYHGLLGISQILSENIDLLSKEDIKDYIFMLDEGLQKNYNYFFNILSLLRINTEPEKYRFAECYLNEITSEAIANIKLSSSKKKITINSSFNLTTKLVCNKHLLIVAITIILSNAIKYSHYNSEVSFSVSVTNDFIEFNINDYGIGISDKQKVRLFDISKKFSNDGTLNESGNGLGLILTQAIANLHGGRLEIKSIEERGTAVTLAIPLTPIK